MFSSMLALLTKKNEIRKKVIFAVIRAKIKMLFVFFCQRLFSTQTAVFCKKIGIWR